MINNIEYFSPEQSRPQQLSPRSPRNRLQRKPQNLRARLFEQKHKRQKSRGEELIGFYSPKRHQEQPILITSANCKQMIKDQTKILKNQRSLTHCSKPDLSNSQIQKKQCKNKQNSFSVSSNQSSNARKFSRMQLQLKALTYENNRLKSQNKTLLNDNSVLKNQMIKLTQDLKNSSSLNLPKPGILGQAYQKIKKLKDTISSQEIQLKTTRQKLLQIQHLNQSKYHLQSWIKALQTFNKDQKEELFQKQKMNRYLQIELRTIKKQKINLQNNKKLQQQLFNTDADNKRLRKMVSQLQSRLKSHMLFELTPDQSQKSQSLLLDQSFNI